MLPLLQASIVLSPIPLYLSSTAIPLILDDGISTCYLMAGSPHPDLRRQVPFRPETHHYWHLCPSPGVCQQAQPPPCGGRHCQGNLISSSSSHRNWHLKSIIIHVKLSKSRHNIIMSIIPHTSFLRHPVNYFDPLDANLVTHQLVTAMGAPVNDMDCIGQTPLFYAVRWTSSQRF